MINKWNNNTVKYIDIEKYIWGQLIKTLSYLNNKEIFETLCLRIIDMMTITTIIFIFSLILVIYKCVDH